MDGEGKRRKSIMYMDNLRFVVVDGTERIAIRCLIPDRTCSLHGNGLGSEVSVPGCELRDGMAVTLKQVQLSFEGGVLSSGLFVVSVN
jgi:hypothetical protein